MANATDAGCWEFTGYRNACGYGDLTLVGRQRVRTHRLVYETCVGPIPDGMVVMHVCDNPPCCNPTHLRSGTQTDNLRDMAAKRRHPRHGKTHCKWGHEFTPENTRMNDQGRKRQCIQCANRNARESYARRSGGRA